MVQLTQLSSHIYKCAFLVDTPLPIPVNVWLIRNGKDVYIVDTGIESFVDQQIEAALSLGTPKAILLTHGHQDHIGGAAKWLEQYDLPVFAHEIELPYIDGEVPYPRKEAPDKTGVAGRVKPLSEEILQKIQVRSYHTPGHSPGHAVFYHEADHVLLAGDLFITSKEALLPPPRRFTPYMNENIDSGAIVKKLKPKLISSSHGQDLIGYSETLYPLYVFQFRD